MGAHAIAPPGRPARASLVRSGARALRALVLGVGAALVAAWLVWKVTWGLVGLAGLFVSTGAHAAVAVALVAVLVAGMPLAIVAVVAAVRGVQRSRDA